MTSSHKFWILILIGLVAVTSSVSIRPTPDRAHLNDSRLIPDTSAVRVVRNLDAGILPSILWVQSIFEYAAVSFDHEDGRYLPLLLDATIAADPLWPYPFEFGAIVLSDSQGVATDQGIALLREGIRRFPGRWKLRVYLAMVLSERGFPPEMVAEPLLEVHKFGGTVPEYARTLAFTILSKAGKGREAGFAFADAIGSAQDPAVRDMLVRRLARQITKDGRVPGEQSMNAALALSDELSKGGQAKETASRYIAAIWEESSRDSSATTPGSESSKSP